MALGQKLLEINFADFAKGVSTSDYISDGGFSPNTDQINLIVRPGVAMQSSPVTDKSTNLVGEMIASCEDPRAAVSSYTRLFVSSESLTTQDGRFWSYDGTTLTQRGSTDSTHNYIFGKTDMIAFDGEVYITNDETLVRWSAVGGANTINNTFFAFNNSIAPHPALVYNNFAYYGDGNLLLRQSAANVAPVTILTLATSARIVALAIDPGSGNILISIAGHINQSGSLNVSATIGFYDGTSNQVSRYVQVDEMVTGFASTEGALYASYGQNLGQWNGSGITFLRHLNVSLNGLQLLYKHHFTSIGSTLYFVQQTKVMAYGPVRQKGDNVFYPALINQAGGTSPFFYTIAVNVGDNQLAVSYATSKFFTWDSMSTTENNQFTLYSNVYEFPDEVWVRRVRLIYSRQVPSGTDPGQIQLYDQDTTFGTPYFASLLNNSGAGSAFKDILNVNIKVKQIQAVVSISSVNMGIRRIIMYGDQANITGSPNN